MVRAKYRKSKQFEITTNHIAKAIYKIKKRKLRIQYNRMQAPQQLNSKGNTTLVYLK
jgi:hypothetical protein